MARLTDRKAKGIKAGDRALAHGGVGGLLLVPSTAKDGVGSWVYTYLDPISGKRTRQTLGRYPTVSIAEAGQQANEILKIANTGQSPRRVIEQSRIEEREAQTNTLEWVCREYFKAKVDKGEWRSPTTAEKMLIRLEKFIYPMLGKMPMKDIKARDIQRCMLHPYQGYPRGIWADSRETAGKVMSFLNQAFTYAEALEIVGHNPVKAARVALGKQIDERQKSEQRMPAMPYQNIPAFVAKALLEGKQTDGKQALLFQILTAARSGAVRNMRWSDIDFERKVWTLPAFSEGGKTAQDREYPLTPAANSILKKRHELAQHHEGLVFESARRRGEPISDVTLIKVIRDAGKIFGTELVASDIKGRIAVPHGFRATFKNWAAVNRFDDVLSELQLCHQYGSEVYQAYHREGLLEQRRVMMERWEAFCLGKEEAGK